MKNKKRFRSSPPQEWKVFEKTQERPNLQSKYTNPLDKANYMKQLLLDNFHIKDIDKLIFMSSRINCYRKSKVKTLTEDERLLYDFFLRMNFNPRAVGDWLLITKMPQKIKTQLRERKIRIKDALRTYTLWKKNYNSITNNVMKNIQKAIRGL